MAQAAPTPASGDNAKTLIVTIPGPFNGCSFLDTGATQSTDAILDLVRPSAFLTNPAGNLYGAGCPVVSAELTSLQPETVVYSLAAHQRWSDGRPFDGTDFVAWWLRARRLANVQSDGYRAIASLRTSAGGLTVTALFRKPYADWNLLFRDIEVRHAPLGCALVNLLRRPSLGPYRVSTVSPSRIVLTMNRQWPNDTGRYGRVILTLSVAIPASATTPFASYSLVVNRSQEQTLSAHPWLFSHLGTSSSIEEITFAARRPLTRVLAIRQALSWVLNRQSLIYQLFGSVTFAPSVGASVLYSQGQSFYPGVAGSNPSVAPTTTSSTTPTGSSTVGLGDCPACAHRALVAAGYRHVAAGWVSPAGVKLSLRIVVGPGMIDHATENVVQRQWKRAGISVAVINASSDVAAASIVASNRADAAIFSRPTSTTPSVTARSWSGPEYVSVYPSGYKSATTTSLFAKATANFNPVAASVTWLTLDQVVMKSFWARPLFTPPSLIEWSSIVNGVTGSLSVPGFTDEIASWNNSTRSSH